MKNLNIYDPLNAATLTAISPEWHRVQKAHKAATSFETPHVAIPKNDLQILPDAGHLSWSDQLGLFGSMIVDWVNEGHKAFGNS